MILPLSYFGPVEEYTFLAQNETIQYEAKEHFVKQSYRNRCEIYGANGTLRLTVPLVLKGREKTGMDKIKIAYHDNWQNHHWRSITSAYKNSPFFYYYEDILAPLFFEEFKYLKDLNLKALEIIKHCLQIDCNHSLTEEFLPYQENDLRLILHPKKECLVDCTRYIQVFEEKHGFQGNLSILDLLFNEGPSAIIYLKNLSIKNS